MKRVKRKSAVPTIPRTWSETLDRCPFRSFIGLPGAGVDDMLGRVGHTFAALGGKPCPIDAVLLAEMAASIRAGRTVLVIADRADLRDRAKREILASVHGAAGCA